jgi:amidase
MSATNSIMGKACGRRQLCMNDLTDKMAPLTQEMFDKMWISGANTIINGVYAWENMPPTVSVARLWHGTPR